PRREARRRVDRRRTDVLRPAGRRDDGGLAPADLPRRRRPARGRGGDAQAPRRRARGCRARGDYPGDAALAHRAAPDDGQEKGEEVMGYKVFDASGNHVAGDAELDESVKGAALLVNGWV